MTDTLRVLYVDDEPGLLEICKRFLEREGAFTVDTLTSAGEALTRLKTERYDAIVSDYQMAEIDGIAFLKHLKKSGNTTPFIIFTGRGREEVVIEALNEGADFYLQKGGEPKSQFVELSNKIRYAITRRHAEEALSESQKRTAEIIEFLPDATFAISTDGVVIAWNRAMEVMTGVVKAEVLNKGSYEYSLPFYNERRPILIDLVLNTDEITAGKYPFIRKEGDKIISEIFIPHFHDGRGAYLWFTASPLYDSQGNITGAIESIRDITVFKHVEVDLRESEIRYRHIVEDQTEFICRFLPDGTHIFVNEAYCRYFGLNREEIIGTRFHPTIHPEDREDVARLIASLKPDRPLMNIDQRIIMPDGTTQWQRWSDRAIFNSDGSLKEYQSVGRDITDWKRSEEALAESESFNRNLVENLPDYIAVYGLDGKILYLNPASERGLGYSAEKLIGTPVLSYVTEEYRDEVVSRTAKRKEGDEVPPYEIDLLTLDGRKRSVIVKGTPIQYHDSPAILLLLIDITERKRAEEALRISEEKFRKAFFISPDSICITRLNDGMFVSVNKGFTEISGYTEEEIIGKTSLEINIWKDPEDRRKIVEGLQANGEVRNYEARFLTKSGEIQGLMSTLIIELNGVPHILNITHNITERKRAEDALRETKERYRTIIDTAQEGIWTLDCNFHINYVNEKIAGMLGYTQNEMLGRSFTEFIPEDELPHANEQVGLRKEGVSETYERRFLHRNGDILIMLTSSSTIYSPDGTFSGSLAMFSDITERKQVEEALRQKEAQLRATLESTADGILAVDTEGKILQASRRFAEIWRIPPAIMECGDDLTLLNFVMGQLNDPDAFLKKVQLLYGSDAVDMDILTFKDGPVFERYSFPMIMDGARIGRVWSFRDITERKLAEEELWQSNRKLKLLSSITRHDINNQLSVLKGYLTILEGNLPDPKLKEYSQKVAIAAQQIYSLIQFTKDYEEIGVKTPEWQDIQTSVGTAANEAPLGQIKLKNDLPVGIEVFADPLIAKVFYNLIDNAVRYGGKITTIRFFVEVSGDHHLVVCEDDGDGIPAEEKKRIFDRGFGKNTGIGLALSREILSLTGITIRETGEPGKGARFEMTVPKGMWRISPMQI